MSPKIVKGSLNQWFSTFFGPWIILFKPLCYADTSWRTGRKCFAQGYNFQESFIKNLWNSLWNTRDVENHWPKHVEANLTLQDLLFTTKKLHRDIFKNCCDCHLCPMSVYIPSLQICWKRFWEIWWASIPRLIIKFQWNIAHMQKKQSYKNQRFSQLFAGKFVFC